MKNLKNFALFLVFAVVAITFASCSDSSDPSPSVVGKTNKEIVQASLVGTWKFDSVRVTENSSGHSASSAIKDCKRTEFEAAGLFSNTKWQTLANKLNLVYSGTNTVGYNPACVTGNPTTNLTWTISERTDNSIDVVLSNGRTFNVLASDVNDKLKTIKASLVNTDGYKVVFSFSLK